MQEGERLNQLVVLELLLFLADCVFDALGHVGIGGVGVFTRFGRPTWVRGLAGVGRPGVIRAAIAPTGLQLGFEQAL